MKKMLAIMLVLGMASIANAALTIQISPDGLPGTYAPAVSSEIVLQPTDTIWIGINQDVDVQFDARIEIVGPGSLTGNYVMDMNHLIPEAYGLPYASNLAYAFNSYPAVRTFEPGVGFGFEFHCDDIGPVDIILTELATGATDILTIHQIPEPMTMALLGLGGLGLLRRRR
jgi:hypothetical protein